VFRVVDLVPGKNGQKNLTFITGGARSGKSRLAERLALESGLPVHYLATMQQWADDDEGGGRIQRHQERRPADWTTHEVPFDLDKAVDTLPAEPAAVIIDCLSVYLSNLLLLDLDDRENPYVREPAIMEKIDLLLRSTAARQEIDFYTVSNEVGWGIVPTSILGRAYRDFLGLANQSLAEAASQVFCVLSGLPVRLK